MSDKALEIKDLKKVYDNGFEALKGINFSVDKGDFFALLGPNGAGKSTTLGIVSSLVNLSQGSVKVFGHDLIKERNKVKTKLGVVPQEFNFNLFEKVEDIVIQQAGYYGLKGRIAKQRTEKYLKALDLWEKRGEQARALSGGMKRRLMIARALVHEPELLILDEPTAGVDIEIRRSMWEYLQQINKEGTTIILTTHYLEEAESLCRNIAIINHGEIVKNTGMKDLLKSMNKSSFVADIEQDVAEDFSMDKYSIKAIDNHSVRFELQKGELLNHVTALLAEQGMDTVSIRPETNRLEELFVDLVNESKEATA